MRRLLAAALVLAFVATAGLAQAQDKPNPTGTWKWTVNFGGQDIDLTLKLKLEGDKLTGAMVRDDQETAIQDGKFKDGSLSFTVVRERNGQKFTVKYNAKLSGDTLKGTSEIDRDGEKMTRDWEAKRAAAASLTGTWKWTVSMGGQDREMTLKLKLDGEKLTGAQLGRDGQETAIQDAKYKNGEMSFTVVRERNGTKITSKYTGKQTGDTIKGKIESDRDGQAQTRDWDAKRAKD
jgi:hypothetical protein